MNLFRTVLLTFVLCAPGCCAQGPDILMIWTMAQSSWSDPMASDCDWGGLTWGGATTIPRGHSVIVVYQGDDDDDIRTAIELWDGDTRVPLVEETAMEHSCQNGCPSPRTLYKLEVAPGEYTLVHRESSGTGKPVHTPGSAAEPWTTFQGERALVTTLTITDQ